MARSPGLVLGAAYELSVLVSLPLSLLLPFQLAFHLRVPPALGSSILHLRLSEPELAHLKMGLSIPALPASESPREVEVFTNMADKVRKVFPRL